MLRFLVWLVLGAVAWLFWLQGAAPLLGGGFGHFYTYAPEKFEYPIDRYAMEVKRQLDVLDRNLSSRRYLSGDDYTIADIATYPWYGNLVVCVASLLALMLDAPWQPDRRRDQSGGGGDVR